jgi:hypothetical protein
MPDIGCGATAAMTHAITGILGFLARRARIITVPGFPQTLAYLNHLRTLCLVDYSSLTALVATIPHAVWLSGELTIELFALIELGVLALRARTTDRPA